MYPPATVVGGTDLVRCVFNVLLLNVEFSIEMSHSKDELQQIEIEEQKSTILLHTETSRRAHPNLYRVIRGEEGTSAKQFSETEPESSHAWLRHRCGAYPLILPLVDEAQVSQTRPP